MIFIFVNLYSNHCVRIKSLKFPKMKGNFDFVYWDRIYAKLKRFLHLVFGVFLIGCLAICTVQVQGQAADPCATQPNNYFRADPESCEGYFTCSNKLSIKQVCPAGFFFAEATQNCVVATGNCVLSACPAKGIDFVPVVNSCTDYIVCVNGVENPASCGAGFLFDKVLKNCNSDYLVDCVVNSCPDPAVDPTVTYIESTRDCNEFYICLNGEPMLQKCAPNFYFNPTTKKCDLQANVQCAVSILISCTYLSNIHINYNVFH